MLFMECASPFFEKLLLFGLAKRAGREMKLERPGQIVALEGNEAVRTISIVSGTAGLLECFVTHSITRGKWGGEVRSWIMEGGNLGWW